MTLGSLSRIVLSVATAASFAGCSSDKSENKEASKTVASSGGKPATPPEAPKPEAPKPAPKAPTGEELAKRYQDCWGFFNSKDLAKFQTCYAPTIVSDFVDSGMPPATSWQQIVDMHSKPIMDAMPDAHGAVELTLINGSNGVTVALFTGTHTGPLATPMGAIPATNKKVGLQVAHTVHFTGDGLTVDKESYYQDQGTLLAQLGVSKAPARAATDKLWPTETVVAKDDATEKKNVETTNLEIAAFNKHDGKGMEALFADDLVWSEVGIPVDWNKKEAIAAHEGLFKGFSDLTITASSVWGAGDYVVMQGTFAGTNDGDVPPPMPIKKTGKKVNLTFLQLYKYNKDGKLVGCWGFWNSAAFAMQLGLVPPAPPAHK